MQRVGLLTNGWFQQRLLKHKGEAFSLFKNALSTNLEEKYKSIDFLRDADWFRKVVDFFHLDAGDAKILEQQSEHAGIRLQLLPTAIQREIVHRSRRFTHREYGRTVRSCDEKCQYQNGQSQFNDVNKSSFIHCSTNCHSEFFHGNGGNSHCTVITVLSDQWTRSSRQPDSA